MHLSCLDIRECLPQHCEVAFCGPSEWMQNQVLFIVLKALEREKLGGHDTLGTSCGIQEI